MQLTHGRLCRGAAVLTLAGLLAACSHSGAHHPSSASPPSSAAHVSGTTAAGPRCPLTGLRATAHQNVKRAPLAVKIDNVDDARPQAGLGAADVVVEELVEGGLTRLMAIFQCNSAASVGPIRSARISDADLLALLHGSVLGFSGANPADLPPIQAHADAVLVSQDATPQYFRRDLSRPAPHNVFASTSTLLTAGLSRRHSLHAPKPLFHYAPHLMRAKRARHVSLRWPASSADWAWSHDRYARSQNGTPDTGVGGKQATAANVLVLGVTIGDSGLRDVLGSPSPIDVTTGSNPMWLFRNGREVSGTWTRKRDTSPLHLRDHHGNVVRLDPGRTWIELLPRPDTPTVSR